MSSGNSMPIEMTPNCTNTNVENEKKPINRTNTTTNAAHTVASPLLVEYTDEKNMINLQSDSACGASSTIPSSTNSSTDAQAAEESPSQHAVHALSTDNEESVRDTDALHDGIYPSHDTRNQKVKQDTNAVKNLSTSPPNTSSHESKKAAERKTMGMLQSALRQMRSSAMQNKHVQAWSSWLTSLPDPVSHLARRIIAPPLIGSQHGQRLNNNKRSDRQSVTTSDVDSACTLEADQRVHTASVTHGVETKSSTGYTRYYDFAGPFVQDSNTQNTAYGNACHTAVDGYSTSPLAHSGQPVQMEHNESMPTGRGFGAIAHRIQLSTHSNDTQSTASRTPSSVNFVQNNRSHPSVNCAQSNRSQQSQPTISDRTSIASDQRSRTRRSARSGLSNQHNRTHKRRPGVFIHLPGLEFDPLVLSTCSCDSSSSHGTDDTQTVSSLGSSSSQLRTRTCRTQFLTLSTGWDTCAHHTCVKHNNNHTIQTDQTSSLHSPSKIQPTTTEANYTNLQASTTFIYVPLACTDSSCPNSSNSYTTTISTTAAVSSIVYTNCNHSMDTVRPVSHSQPTDHTQRDNSKVPVGRNKATSDSFSSRNNAVVTNGQEDKSTSSAEITMANITGSCTTTSIPLSISNPLSTAIPLSTSIPVSTSIPMSTPISVSTSIPMSTPIPVSTVSDNPTIPLSTSISMSTVSDTQSIFNSMCVSDTICTAVPELNLAMSCTLSPNTGTTTDFTYSLPINVTTTISSDTNVLVWHPNASSVADIPCNNSIASTQNALLSTSSNTMEYQTDHMFPNFTTHTQVMTSEGISSVSTGVSNLSETSTRQSVLQPQLRLVSILPPPPPELVQEALEARLRTYRSDSS